MKAVQTKAATAARPKATDKPAPKTTAKPLKAVKTSEGVIALRDITHPTDQSALLLAKEIRAGLPIAAVDALIEGAIVTAKDLDQVVLPRKTLSHRRKLGRLTPDQSDRLLRFARIVGLAQDVFGLPAKADEWLRRATSVLGGQSPLDMLDTEIGARQVETLLGRIAHGIAA